MVARGVPMVLRGTASSKVAPHSANAGPPSSGRHLEVVRGVALRPEERGAGLAHREQALGVVEALDAGPEVAGGVADAAPPEGVTAAVRQRPVEGGEHERRAGEDLGRRAQVVTAAEHVDDADPGAWGQPRVGCDPVSLDQLVGRDTGSLLHDLDALVGPGHERTCRSELGGAVQPQDLRPLAAAAGDGDAVVPAEAAADGVRPGHHRHRRDERQHPLHQRTVADVSCPVRAAARRAVRPTGADLRPEWRPQPGRAGGRTRGARW
jgi:hypothetical protein